MTDSLKRIAELVRQESGIVLQPTQLPSLRAAVRRACGGAPDDFLALTLDKGGESATVARLLDEVAVKETSFLRDARQLDAFDWRDALVSAETCGDRQVRVWSAGCATGEEVYTLALLSMEAFGRREPPVSILGTDLSEAALERAAGGRYGKRSVRAVPDVLARRYFEPDGDGLAVGVELKRLVRFAQHNLVRDGAPPLGEGRFDLVVCRNVLIYFEPETARRVVDGLESALRPGGRLLLGAADALCGGTRSHRVVKAASAELERQPGRAPRTLPTPRFEDRLAAAAHAADVGRTDKALAAVEELLRERPLAAAAHYLRGVVALERAELPIAVQSFRRALSVDPSFGLFAFKLGRAYEALGNSSAARSAYEQALRGEEGNGAGRYAPLLAQVDPADVAAACRSRLRRLA